MAKQAGILKLTGTIGTLCFYQREENYYVRRKSSLTGRRVKSDPAFGETMRYAGLLGKASKIAAAIYRELTVTKKREWPYRKLTGQVMQLLRQETDENTIIALLKERTGVTGSVKNQ